MSEQNKNVMIEADWVAMFTNDQRTAIVDACDEVLEWRGLHKLAEDANTIRPLGQALIIKDLFNSPSHSDELDRAHADSALLTIVLINKKNCRYFIQTAEDAADAETWQAKYDMLDSIWSTIKSSK